MGARRRDLSLKGKAMTKYATVSRRLMMQYPYKTALLLSIMLLISGCAAGRSAFSKAEKLERDGNMDEAVIRYADALQSDPTSSEYKVRFLKAKTIAASLHFKAGERYMAGKNYDEALREYQTALALDSSIERSKQQADIASRYRDAIFFYNEGQEFEKGRKPKEAYRSYQKSLELNPASKETREALDKMLRSKRPKLDGYELNVKSNKPITLKFKDAKVKEVFNILSKLTGINFMFDEGMKDQNISIYLENATFLQSLDIICGLNKLGKKVLNESSIIIYAKTPDKSKQYEELMVQTFYLTNLDAKKAVNLLRTMLQLKKVYVNEDLNAIVVRDTPEMLEVAQKVLDANDLADAEVLLEVEVIELTKKNAENFGLALSKYAVSSAATHGGTLLSDTLTTSAATSTTTTTTTPSLLSYALGRVNGVVTVPNATYNFGKTMGNGEVLSNPKIRVKNKEKSKFNVGTRVPITTTSSNGTAGGFNVNVQYVDVGVKVNAEPNIQLDNQITLKLSLEVSSILSKDTVGSDKATTVVTIGTRNLDTVLTIRDGETTVIGGLIEDTKSRSKDKIFLLGDIPFLGPLISNNNNSNDKREVILAITPRIVRALPVPDSDMAVFWSGKEDEPSVKKPYASFTQEPEFVELAPVDIPTAPKPAAPSQPALPARPTGQPPQPPAPEVKPAAEPEKKGTLTISAPASVVVGEQFVVEVKATDAKNLYSAPFTLSFDPIFADFIGVIEGGFLKQDGKQSTFGSSVDANSGTINISNSRVGEVEGVSGSGTLAKATFKAKNAGPLNFGFQNLNFTAPGAKSLEFVPYNLAVEVK